MTVMNPLRKNWTANWNHQKLIRLIVFNSCFDQLLTRCLKCGHVVSSQKKKTVGSMLSVELTCHQGHVTHWDSQPTIRRKLVGNLLLAATILFTGHTFASFSRLASCLKLQFLRESVFYDFQRRFLFPVLIQTREDEQHVTLQELLEKKTVNLNGDGRCDSPGHNTKYSTYTLMDVDTGKVVGFSVVQVSETISSNATDKEGFKRCLQSFFPNRVFFWQVFSGLRSNRICFVSGCSALLVFRTSLPFLLYFCIYRPILYVIYCMSELIFPSLTGTKTESLFGAVVQMHLLQCQVA